MTSTGYKYKNVKISRIGTGGLLLVLWMLSGCFPKLYQQPKIGAEHKIEQGYPPEKNPKPLFNKKMRKDLSQKGKLRNSK